MHYNSKTTQVILYPIIIVKFIFISYHEIIFTGITNVKLVLPGVIILIG